jgi:hypothetical protein
MTDTSDFNYEGVMRRIAKLMAIANDHRADPAEAAAAAGMATKIMRKYQIDNVEAYVKPNADDIDVTYFTKSAKLSGDSLQVPPWVQWVGVGVAKLNNCHVSIKRTPDGQVGLRFGGFKSDLAVAQYQMDYLVGTINRLCDQNRMENAPSRSSSKAYRIGVAMGVSAKIRDVINAQKQEDQASSTGTALVVAKDTAVAKRFGELRTKDTKTRISDPDAKSRGYQDGKSVNVAQRAVGTSKSSTLAIRG